MAQIKLKLISNNPFIANNLGVERIITISDADIMTLNAAPAVKVVLKILLRALGFELELV